MDVEEQDGPASRVALRPDPGAAHGCVCGARYTNLAALAKRGWEAAGSGDAALVVVCSCGAAITVDVVRDACLCGTCRRLVTGSDGDVKACVLHRGASLVLCMSCFRRDGRRQEWLAWRSEVSAEPRGPWVAACGRAVEAG
jgi:hypothetical protein